MINKENSASTMLNPNPNTIGVLTDTEVLLVGIVQRKRVLRSILLPPDVSELSELLEHLWQAGLNSVWVMPATILSRTATCARFEQINGPWISIPMMESARDLVWKRPLTLVEQRQRYLYKYNHISPYLEACRAVRLGAGASEFSSNGRAYDGIRPGIWHIQAEQAGSIFDGK